MGGVLIIQGKGRVSPIKIASRERIFHFHKEEKQLKWTATA